LHAGNLGFYGAWDTLLSGAASLAADGIGLVFVGDGAQRPRLEATAANIPNVRFLPFFPANKVSSVLAAADAHIITIKRGLEGVVVPSKMYGILAAGKPIVAVAPANATSSPSAKKKAFPFPPTPATPPDLRNSHVNSPKIQTPCEKWEWPPMPRPQGTSGPGNSKN